METFFWIAVGAFVGWNFPQPSWARTAQSKLIDFFNRSK